VNHLLIDRGPPIRRCLLGAVVFLVPTAFAYPFTNYDPDWGVLFTPKEAAALIGGAGPDCTTKDVREWLCFRFKSGHTPYARWWLTEYMLDLLWVHLGGDPPGEWNRGRRIA
jgi:hypothetical protein